MNFNINENPDYNLTDYESIKKDYISSDLTVKEIQTKYSLEKRDWNEFLRQIKSENIPVRDGSTWYKQVKNYCYNIKSKKWEVYKYINYKRYFFGGYKTEKEAQNRVEELKRNNWEGLLNG